MPPTELHLQMHIVLEGKGTAMLHHWNRVSNCMYGLLEMGP